MPSEIKPGRFLGRYVRALAANGGDVLSAAEYADRQRWADGDQIKAAIEMQTADPNSPIAARPGIDLIRLALPQSIVGKLPLLRRVPFFVHGVEQTGGANAFWVSEGRPAPMAAPSFRRGEPLPANKLTALSVITKELARSSLADVVIGQVLADSVVSALDSAFIDGAAGDDSRPSSVVHAAVTVAASSSLSKDFSDALGSFEGSLSAAAWIANPRTAAAIALKSGFDSLGATGGSLLGVPVVTSEAVDAGNLILLDQSAIQLAGADSARLRTSQHASIEMSDSPDSPARMVSLWQANALGMLAEISVNWRLAGNNRVVVLSGIE